MPQTLTSTPLKIGRVFIAPQFFQAGICLPTSHHFFRGFSYPIAYIYGIFTYYIYHKTQQNVVKYTIHGSYGYVSFCGGVFFDLLLISGDVWSFHHWDFSLIFCWIHPFPTTVAFCKPKELKIITIGAGFKYNFWIWFSTSTWRNYSRFDLHIYVST